jgi:hypothetical protein
MKLTICVVAALAALSLAACTSGSGSAGVTTSVPTPAVSVSPSPTTPPELPLTGARLAGTYAVKVYVTHNTFDSNPASTQKFRFEPKCDEGACDVMLSGVMEFGKGLADRQQAGAEKRFLIRMANLGRGYGGTKVGYFASCGNEPDKDRWTFDIKVDRAKYVDGVWTVTRWSGVWTRDSGFGGECRPGKLKAVIRGTL